MPAAALIAMHYQNENCYPDGRIKIGIADENTWREARLANARRLFAGFRALALPIVHVRLAVRPDFFDVVTNTPIFRQWIENDAWREGTWGVDFVDGLGPEGAEHVVTHTRNGGFHGSTLAESLFLLKPERLYCSSIDGVCGGEHGAGGDGPGLGDDRGRRCLLHRNGGAARGGASGHVAPCRDPHHRRGAGRAVGLIRAEITDASPETLDLHRSGPFDESVAGAVELLRDVAEHFQGWRAGFTAAAGLALGSLVHVALTVAGLSALIAHSPTGYMILKYLGAAYLTYLGVRTLMAAGTATPLAGEPAPPKPCAASDRKHRRRGAEPQDSAVLRGFPAPVRGPGDRPGRCAARGLRSDRHGVGPAVRRGGGVGRARGGGLDETKSHCRPHSGPGVGLDPHRSWDLGGMARGGGVRRPTDSGRGEYGPRRRPPAKSSRSRVR